LAALLIHVGGWRTFLLGIAALGLVGAAVTLAYLPATGGWALPGGARVGSLRRVVGDRPFALLLLSTLLGFFVYCGFETVLPVIAVTSYGLSASTWGLLVVISPLLVVFFQLRLTRIASRLPARERLAGALLVMGLPFLALVASGEVVIIGVVIVIFVIGEMLWMPTSQAVAARVAPPPARGAYFGALAAMTGPAWTLAPFIALELRSHVSVGSVWVFFAAAGIAGAVAGFAAVRAAESRRTAAPASHRRAESTPCSSVRSARSS
jgi:predicted MFS family arabinose efflux permease